MSIVPRCFVVKVWIGSLPNFACAGYIYGDWALGRARNFSNIVPRYFCRESVIVPSPKLLARALFIRGMGIGLPQLPVNIVPRIFMRKTEHPEKSPLHDAAVNPKRPSGSGQTRNRAEFNVCSSGDCPSTDRSGKASSAYCGWVCAGASDRTG